MRALLWNRPDAELAPGGDTVQWRETAAALEALGVEVVRTVAPADALRGELDPERFDLVHLFNLQTEGPALSVAKRVRERPLVLSTIWWDLSEGRYARRLARKPSLRLQERLLGRERCLERFRARDRARKRGRQRDADARELLERATVLLPNARLETEALETYFALELAERVAIVPNAVRLPAELAELPGAARRAGILSVGRLGPIKNQLSLIEASAGLAPLTLVGPCSDPSYLRACEAAAARHGACRILSARPQAELWSLYAEARVHALPSYRETPGLVSLEAGALGCGVVSTDRGSTREYFEQAVEYCDPFDSTSIRGALERALADPRPLPSELLARYTWERAARATHLAYRFALGESVSLPDSLAGPLG